MFSRVPRIGRWRCGRRRCQAARAVERHRVGAPTGAGEGGRHELRALSLLRFENRLRPDPRAVRQSAPTATRSRAAHRPPAGSGGVPTPGPALHANAWTKRSSRSGASTTPMRSESGAQSRQGGGHPLDRRELVAQGGGLLEPAAASELVHPRLDRRVGSTSGSPCSHRLRRGHRLVVGRHRVATRGRERGSGPALRPGRYRRRPGRSGRQVRRPRPSRTAAAAVCARDRDPIGPADTAPGCGRAVTRSRGTGSSVVRVR